MSFKTRHYTHSVMLFRSLQMPQENAGALTTRGTWSLPESKLHIKYLELKVVFSDPKRVLRPLFKQDWIHSNRQHHSYCLHKQVRTHEVRPTVCPTMANPDLVLQESDDPQ